MSRFVFAFVAASLLLPVLHAEDAKPEAPKAKPEAPKEEGGFATNWEESLLRLRTPVGQFSAGGYTTLIHRTIDKYNGGDSKNFFDAIRVVPQFNWRMTNWLEFETEIEFEGGGADASFLSGQEVLVEYAEARIHAMDELNIEFGLLLIPFGRYNLYHDDIFWDIVDRPFPARLIAATAFDQPGVGLNGSFSQVPFIGINYEVCVTQGFDNQFTSNSGSRDARQSFRDDNNDNKAIWARLGLVPDFRTSVVTGDVGFSYTYQEVGAGNTQATRGCMVDGAFKFRIIERFGIDVFGEWGRLWINRPSSPTTPNGLWAWNLDVLFKIDPFPNSWKGDTLGRNPYIGVVIRIEQCDLNDDFKGSAAGDDRIAITGGITFRPLAKLIFRMEFKHFQSRERDDGDETNFVLSTSVGF